MLAVLGPRYRLQVRRLHRVLQYWFGVLYSARDG